MAIGSPHRAIDSSSTKAELTAHIDASEAAPLPLWVLAYKSQSLPQDFSYSEFVF